jgi:hypothetical protein
MSLLAEIGSHGKSEMQNAPSTTVKSAFYVERPRAIAGRKLLEFHTQANCCLVFHGV